MRKYQALILSASLLMFFSIGVVAQNPADKPESSENCHKPVVKKSQPKHTAAAPQTPPPADGKAFCYNYKRPDQKVQVLCKCNSHRGADGKCWPAYQEGPNKCTNHCKTDMCKCTNPCKS